jgi:SPP1 family predicted phage head-tail adaptor
MRAGRLRFRVRIEESVETRNAVGEVIQTWCDRGSIWADIEPVRGEERLTLMQSKAVADTKLTTRASAARQVNAKMRFVYQDRTFDVDANIDWRNRGVFREIYCKEAA